MTSPSPVVSPGMGHNNPAGNMAAYRTEYGSHLDQHHQFQQQQQQQQLGKGAGQNSNGVNNHNLVGSLNRLSILPEEAGDQVQGHPHSQNRGGEGDYAGYHPAMQMNGGQMQGGGYAAFGEGNGGFPGQSPVGRFGRDSAGANNNNLLSPNQGHLQPQGQQQQQTSSVSPSYQQSMQNGYRSPSVSSPNHQHVGPNANGQVGGQMEFPASASSVTAEQAARYGIAGLGTPLGSAGIGAWMDGVNAAGVKSAGGNGSGWLESSPLQQQQQQQGPPQQGQGNARRNLADREGASSAALPSPNATGNAGSPFAAHSRPNPQDVGNANWSGFPSTGSEQGRNQGQGNSGQSVAGPGKSQSQQRGSQSTQGQGGSRPSSSAQQRQQSQSQQTQQQQQQSPDEAVDGNNAGDANGEVWSRSKVIKAGS